MEPTGTRQLAVVAAVLAVTLASVALFSAGLTPSHYKTLHFALSYETEFLKRGAVGELFRHLGLSPWGRAPGLFSALVLVLLGAVYATAAVALLRQRGSAILAGLLVALWASPAALPHLAYDFGRFDALLILLLGLWGLASVRLRAVPSLVLLAAVSAAALAVHEIALFATLPIGLVLWQIRYREAPVSARTVAFGAAAALGFALIWRFGGADVLTPDQITGMIAERYGPGDYSIELIRLVLFGTAAENAAYSAAQGARYGPFDEHLSFLLLMGAYVALIGALAVAALRRLPRAAVTGALACLAPLALYPLGYDYFRWLSFVLLDASMLAVWAMLHDPRLTDAVVEGAARWRAVVFALPVLFLATGPVGIFTAFASLEAPLTGLLQGF